MTANPSFGKFALLGEEIISASGMFFNRTRPISGPSEAAVFSLIIVHPASVYVPFSAHYDLMHSLMMVTESPPQISEEVALQAASPGAGEELFIIFVCRKLRLQHEILGARGAAAAR